MVEVASAAAGDPIYEAVTQQVPPPHPHARLIGITALTPEEPVGDRLLSTPILQMRKFETGGGVVAWPQSLRQ